MYLSFTGIFTVIFIQYVHTELKNRLLMNLGYTEDFLNYFIVVIAVTVIHRSL